MNKHLSIYLSNTSSIENTIKLLTLSITNLENNYILYSDSILKNYLKQELDHGLIKITLDGHQPLHKMSSGQQRKALLNHLLATTEVKYLILDNPTANLDTENKKWIYHEIRAAADHIGIIQLTYRKEEMFDWIEDKYTIRDHKLVRLTANESIIRPSHMIRQDLLLQLLNSNEASVKKEYPSLIKLSRVNVSYGEKHVLKDLSLEVRPGEFWHIKGPNGSGKSTLLSMIYGDNPKAYGQDITIFNIKKGSGENIWDLKKKIGYYAPNLITHHYRNDSVINMILGGLHDTIGLYSKPTSHQIHIVRQWITATGLQYLAQKNLRMITPGQQAITMIIRAIVKNPPLLILDEPTTNLDDENAALVVELINAIAKSKTTAIIYVSHHDEKNLEPDFMLAL